MLKNLTDEEIDEWARNDSPVKFNLLKIPCHSQAVERNIQLVSAASMKCSTIEGRDVLIRNTKSSRAKIPKFDSKQDYKF